ncbi:hypothetical protein ACHAWF_010868 [Thalassiosira exigua]
MPRMPSLLKASFLHEDDISSSSSFSSASDLDDDQRELSRVGEDLASASGSSRSVEGSDRPSGEDDGGGARAARRRSTAPSTPSAEGAGGGRLGIFRQTSQATNLTASHSDHEDNPHRLAALVALEVGPRFLQSLPEALREDYDARDVAGPFETREIVLGPLLGSGEFSDVYEVQAFRPDPSLAFGTDDEEESKARAAMKRNERTRDKKKKARYAVKHLRPELLVSYDRLQYAQAASDLAQEAQFLGSLQHPHVIKLRGASRAGPGGFAAGPKGYFLIIDRLEETLDKRIRRWRRERKVRDWKRKVSGGVRRRLRMGGGGGKAHATMAKDCEGKGGDEATGDDGRDRDRSGATGDGAASSTGRPTGAARRTTAAADGDDDDGDEGDVHKAWIEEEERVQVGLQISSALTYLHERRVMFRDLKPQNVGFDVRGDVKLFDFGLATIMPPFGDPYEDKFQMSGAGSPRYMAPEVLVDPPERYNLKADAYTLGIVLWEMFSLEVPFGHVRGRDELVEFVVEKHGRPPIDDSWPGPIKDAIQQSFDPDPNARPSVQLFYNVLRFQLLLWHGDSDRRLSHRYIQRRRSFGSQRDIMGAAFQAADEEGGTQEGQHNGHHREKFPRRVKKILNHVKGAPSPTARGDENPPPSQQRTRSKFRDKFRLSLKQDWA